MSWLSCRFWGILFHHISTSTKRILCDKWLRPGNLEFDRKTTMQLTNVLVTSFRFWLFEQIIRPLANTMYFCKLSYLVSLLENGLSFVSDTPPAGDIFEQHWEFCSVFGSNEMLSMRPTRKWITRANSVNDSLEMCSVCSTTAADIKVEDCQDLCRRAQQLGPNKLRPTASVFCHFLVSKKKSRAETAQGRFLLRFCLLQRNT